MTSKLPKYLICILVFPSREKAERRWAGNVTCSVRAPGRATMKEVLDVFGLLVNGLGSSDLSDMLLGSKGRWWVGMEWDPGGSE